MNLIQNNAIDFANGNKSSLIRVANGAEIELFYNKTIPDGATDFYAQPLNGYDGSLYYMALKSGEKLKLHLFNLTTATEQIIQQSFVLFSTYQDSSEGVTEVTHLAKWGGVYWDANGKTVRVLFEASK